MVGVSERRPSDTPRRLSGTECKRRRTRWRMTQSDANRSLRKFPDHQGKNREFPDFGPIPAAIMAKNPFFIGHF